MNDSDVRNVFDRVLAGEPELALNATDVTNAVHKAHRTRTLRRSALLSATAAVAAIVIAVPLVSRDAKTTTRVVPFSAAAQVVENTTGAPASRLAAPDSDQLSRIRDAITAASPANWTFSLEGNNGFDYALDGTVEDGAGPGRLLVAVTNHKGYQIVHPCTDSEFKSGVSCTDSTLADGSVLTVRGLVDYKGIKTLAVVLSHQDGTGVFIESGNFTVPPVDKEYMIRKANHQPQVDVSRPEPTYSSDQLVELIKAVDAASR